MFWTRFWEKSEDRLLLDGARVGCPLRGADVDIEECLTCRELQQVRVSADPPYLVCTGSRTDPRASALTI